ncbi:MAG: AI-2E family transporter [Sulfurovum sp.]|nr:AI-2E family transporter [Sulfurovum sp.]MDD3601770.1 AI-2E family transporter [Sulfurovum sp.]
MSKTNLIITALFVLAIMGAYSIYKPFLLAMSVAILLTMATFNLTNKLMRFTNSSKLSAGISSLLLTLLLFVPIIYLTTTGVAYITTLDSATIKEMTGTLRYSLENIPFLEGLGKEYLDDEKIAGYIKDSASYFATAGSAGLGFIKNIFLVIVFYFFINYYGNRLFETILTLLPISPAKGTKMMQEISATMEVVLYSVVVTAIFEGFLFGIMVSFFGFNGLLLGIVYGFASLIPVVGGVVVWGPVALYSWTGANEYAAIFIMAYSIIVISIIADTFIKPIIIKIIKENLFKSTFEVNELVIFFSILAGMGTYGFWGMILGPATTSFLIAITKVYLDYNETDTMMYKK